MTFNAGVEAAAAIMDDLDRGGWWAAAIRARARRDEPPEADILDAMVEAAAGHFGIEPKPDDPKTPQVRRCMDAVLVRLRTDGVVDYSATTETDRRDLLAEARVLLGDLAAVLETWEPNPQPAHQRARAFLDNWPKIDTP